MPINYLISARELEAVVVSRKTVERDVFIIGIDIEKDATLSDVSEFRYVHKINTG